MDSVLTAHIILFIHLLYTQTPTHGDISSPDVQKLPICVPNVPPTKSRQRGGALALESRKSRRGNTRGKNRSLAPAST